MLFVVLLTYAVISSFFVQCGPGSLQFIEGSRRLYLLAGASSARSIAASSVSLPPSMLDLFFRQEAADFEAFSRLHREHPQGLLIHAVQPEPQRTNNTTHDDSGPDKYADLEPLITPVLQQLWRDHKKSRSTELTVLWVVCAVLSVSQLYQVVLWLFSTLRTPKPTRRVNGTNQGALHNWASPSAEPIELSDMGDAFPAIEVLQAVDPLPANEDVLMESTETISSLFPSMLLGIAISSSFGSATSPADSPAISEPASSRPCAPANGPDTPLTAVTMSSPLAGQVAAASESRDPSVMDDDAQTTSGGHVDTSSTVNVLSDPLRQRTLNDDNAPCSPSEVVRRKQGAINPVSDDQDKRAIASRTLAPSSAPSSAGPSFSRERQQVDLQRDDVPTSTAVSSRPVHAIDRFFMVWCQHRCKLQLLRQDLLAESTRRDEAGPWRR
ncbi:hypothetical protein D9615_003181 [Tricholomella constricta]|uniref:Transmembrane protein n=1 Tax=Tricholomella constricta TaxID=117010 RepID=A0A8H5HIX9_9AGAR|nr:hypothetical protein D9615_003181 [Tricholomella constricta]